MFDKGVRTGNLLLIGAAALIWARDLAWMNSPSETLPLAFGLGLMIWIGSPWIRLPQQEVSKTLLAIFGALFLAGWIVANVTLMSFAWVGLAAGWIKGTYDVRARLWPTLLIGLFSFPWLLLEWSEIGWWFRYTAAAACGSLFELLALPVERSGTQLMVVGVPIDVTEACAGWNLLQLSFLFGLSVAGWHLRGPRFFIVFALLAPLAWLGNAVRIALISALALSSNVELASGALHTLTGLFVLILTFLVTRFLCEVVRPNTGPPTITREITA